MLRVHGGKDQLMALLAEDEPTWTLIGECAEAAAETAADGAAMEEKAAPDAVEEKTASTAAHC